MIISEWEWADSVPDREEVVGKLSELPPVWNISVDDYIDYVLPMTNRQKEKDEKGREKYVSVTKLYMQVAGRIKMLEHAQAENNWSVHEFWDMVSTDPVVMRCTVAIESVREDGNVSVGSRSGIAKIAGGNAPWEKMETAARGRALGAWGFGVLPGSGMASADEMQGLGDLTPEAEEAKEKRTPDEIREAIMLTRTELAGLRDQELEELDEALSKHIKNRFGKDVLVDGVLDTSELKEGQLVLVYNDLVKAVSRLKEEFE